MTLPKTFCAILLVGFYLTFHSPKFLRADFVFSAATDFSSNTNPNGVWTFGENINLLNQGTFTRYQNFGKNFADASPADQLDAWFNDGPNLSIPAVLHNGTNGVVQFTNPGTTTVIYQPGELAFHPGFAGELSVVRFTAPITALYTVQSAFRAVDTGATTEVSVVTDNTLLFTGNVDPGFSTGFNSTISLQSGQFLDFTVGARGSSLSDTTGASIQITAVPEPSSVAMLTTLTCLGLTMRRLRKPK